MATADTQFAAPYIPPAHAARAEAIAGGEDRREHEYEKWMHWPVNWNAVIIGALAALAVALLITLIAVAVGAHLVGPDNRIVDLRTLSFTGMAFSVLGAFLAFVVGGWVAGKVAGILRSEPGMLHGAIVWLVTIPVLVLLASLGAGGYTAGWYSALGGRSAAAVMPYERPDVLVAPAPEQLRRANEAAWARYHEDVARWRDETPRATRNSAILAITSLLLGLMGSVVGGWMASEEPMTLMYHRQRQNLAGRPQFTH